LKLTSYDTENFYDATVSFNDDGTVSIDSVTEVPLTQEDRSRGLEGITYVDESYPGFDVPSVLLSEFASAKVVAFEVDALGNPVAATEQDFITGFPRTGGGPEGLVTDPLTGDILLSVYGDDAASQVLLITAESPEPTVPDTNPFDAATSLDLSSGLGMGSGAVSTGNQVFTFDAMAGDLLTLDVDVTDVSSGPAYTNDDSVLYLYNSAGQILAVGEDKADSLASRIVNYLIPEDGTYYAAVTSGGNDPIVELGRPFNTLTGFEENGLGDIAFDFSVGSTPLPETARLFDIAFAEEPGNPFGTFLIDGDQVLFIDLNGSRNTDLTGPLSVFVNAEDNTLTFDNFEFVLQFDELFPSNNLNDILDILDEVGVTAIVPPDELIEEIVFSERSLPGASQSVPEPASVLGLLAFGALGASSVLKRKQQQKS
jgi:hypothetical protein